jgi:multidrug efflux pump subunit AcrA (membrane-fusion protein)
MAAFTARKSVLDQDTARDGNTMSLATPCAGTVLKLHVQQRGTVVHEGDVLAELVCANEPLQAELQLPERGIALARAGQSVKLLYDAFPYERYGVQYGTLTWLSPASSAKANGSGFRAFAALGAETVGVQGQPRAVLPGMTGRAAVIVGRRSLASYAIEPLRLMRESLAAGPSPGASRSGS